MQFGRKSTVGGGQYSHISQDSFHCRYKNPINPALLKRKLYWDPIIRKPRGNTEIQISLGICLYSSSLSPASFVWTPFSICLFPGVAKRTIWQPPKRLYLFLDSSSRELRTSSDRGTDSVPLGHYYSQVNGVLWWPGLWVMGHWVQRLESAHQNLRARESWRNGDHRGTRQTSIAAPTQKWDSAIHLRL